MVGEVADWARTLLNREGPLWAALTCQCVTRSKYQLARRWHMNLMIRGIPSRANNTNAHTSTEKNNTNTLTKRTLELCVFVHVPHISLSLLNQFNATQGNPCAAVFAAGCRKASGCGTRRYPEVIHSLWYFTLYSEGNCIMKSLFFAFAAAICLIRKFFMPET